MLLEDALKEIGAEFHSRGIPVATTRAFGPVAAMYPTPECRPTSDLDLVTAPGDYQNACLCVQELGFARAGSGQMNTFRRGLVNLDLMCGLTGLVAVTGLDIEADNFPGLDQAWTHARVPADKTGVSRLELPAEFLLAALHYAYKHRFSSHIWGLDLLLMAGSLTPEQERKLLEFTEKTRAAKLLAAAIRRAAMLIDGVHAPVSRLASRLPAHDPNFLRRHLLDQPAGHERGKDAGMLLALFCTNGPAGFVRLAWHMLSRQPRERTFAGFAGRLLRLPLRVARVLAGMAIQR